MAGRPEKPLDPADGPVPQFALGLRDLKAAAGLSYREMSAQAHYSAPALSTAAAGDRLPSWQVTKAYVQACAGDLDAWHQRWLTTKAKVLNVSDEPAKATDRHVEITRVFDTKKKKLPSKSVVLTLAVVVVVSMVVGMVTVRLLNPPNTPTPQNAAPPPTSVTMFDTMQPVAGTWSRPSAVGHLGGDLYPQTVQQLIGPCSVPATIEYNLGKNYRRFVAFAGVDDTSRSTAVTVGLRLVADGRDIFNRVFKFGEAPVGVDLDTTGVLRLRIVVTTLDPAVPEGLDAETCRSGSTLDLAQGVLLTTAAAATATATTD